MEQIHIDKVQTELNRFLNKEVYVHLETTNGAYASHFDDKAYNVGAFIRNAKVTYQHAKIVGINGAYRVGLKMDIGWVYAEGINQYEVDNQNRLLMAGHDREGRLMVTLEISETPFSY
ncbi:YojF family protein [Aquibacillus salsiterrae]|uniref:YojF family protein n=1 Tax=Aquibacillus salsiterrae TaxID=2950439 RepID=A0A9X3WEW5_9BACI|nr:YojF family protein [Aquibacillus salsiterrae]MDC3416149.1 YojF family protein [Aquibacillus salsiterrae]